jgi:hypothetical protein
LLAETTQFYTQKTHFIPNVTLLFQKIEKKLPQIADLEWVGLS